MAITYYSHLNDVIRDYVEPALNGWEEDYDIEAIAHEISQVNQEYNAAGIENTPEQRRMMVDESTFDFWEIVAAHETQA